MRPLPLRSRRDYVYPYETIKDTMKAIRDGGWQEQWVELAEPDSDPLGGAREQVREKRRNMEENMWVRERLAHVEVIEIHRDQEYCLAYYLTDEGEACHKAIQENLVWSALTSAADIPKTIEFWEGILEQAVHEDNYRAIASLKGDVFRPLIGKAVMHKMQSRQDHSNPKYWIRRREFRTA